MFFNLYIDIFIDCSVLSIDYYFYSYFFTVEVLFKSLENRIDLLVFNFFINAFYEDSIVNYYFIILYKY